METFFVMGPDGREYGPVGADVLRHWQAEGRVHAGSPLRSSLGRTLTLGQLFPTSTVYPPGVMPQPVRTTEPHKFPPGVIALFVGIGFCFLLMCAARVALPGIADKLAEEKRKEDAQAKPEPVDTVGLVEARQVVSALAAYAVVNNAHLPRFGDGKMVQQAVSPFVKDAALRQNLDRYDYNPDLSERVPGRMTNGEAVWLVRDSKPNSIGQNAVCMVDGECVLLTPTQFKYRCLSVKPEFQTTTALPHPPHRAGR